MLPPDMHRQLRHLRLQARRALEGLAGGDALGLFRGPGLTFDEVREYQPSDDARSIDWNVTARMGQPYVKQFRADRERLVMICLDTGPTMRFGSGQRSKWDVAAELAAIIAFAASTQQDRVGLLLASSQVEHYLSPAKSSRHLLRLLGDIVRWPQTATSGSLRAMMEGIRRVVRRRALVTVFSDFLDPDAFSILRGVARRHDLIGVRVLDSAEQELPNVGLANFRDAASGRVVCVDTASHATRLAFAEAAKQREARLTSAFRQAGADLLCVDTEGRHLDQLVAFLKRRLASHRRAHA